MRGIRELWWSQIIQLYKETEKPTCPLSMSLLAFSESIVSVLFLFPFLRAWVLVTSSVCKVVCIVSISYQRFSEIVGGNAHVDDAISDVAQKLMFFLKNKNKRIRNIFTTVCFIMAIATQINYILLKVSHHSFSH